MKSSFFLLFVVLFADAASGQVQSSPAPAQTPPASAQAPPGSAPNQLKVRGPEAVAHQDPNKVVAIINGKQITAQQALDLLKAFPPEQRKRYESNLPMLIQQVYMSQELANEATKMNLDQQEPWKEQLRLARINVLTQAYLAKQASNAPGGAIDPQQYYNAHPDDFDQVKLSGIFVGFNPPGTPAASASASRTEEQARDKATDLEKRLKAGTDFSTLARTDSDNQQAAARGGDLGTYKLGDAQLPAEVKSVITKLKPGEISEPIRIPTGLLIIKLDSRNKQTLDQARPEIVQKLQTEKNQATVKQEMDKYKIQVQDPDFFSAGNTAGPNIPSLQRPATGTPATSPSKPQSQK